MRFETLVTDLLGYLDAYYLPGDRSVLLRLLQKWLKSHLGSFGAQARQTWELERLVAMDLARLPIEESTLDPDEEVQRLKSLRPKSRGELAMRLRDIFWQGVTVESDVTCPRCGGEALRVLVEQASDSIVLECYQCAWCQTPDGSRWKGTSLLQPAPRSRVQESRNTAR